MDRLAVLVEEMVALAGVPVEPAGRRGGLVPVLDVPGLPQLPGGVAHARAPPSQPDDLTDGVTFDVTGNEPGQRQR